MERLAELAQYDQAFNGSLIDDDFLAAGFTPDEVSSYRSQTEPQPMMQADRQAITDQYGTLQEPDYTRRERMAQGSQDFLTNTFGMEPYNAGVLSRSILGDPNAQGDALSGMGLTDFTPLGAVFGAEEGAATASRGYDAGDPLQMGLGGLEAGLSIAEAFPIARLAASPLKRAVAEIADEVLNSEAARSIIDSPLAGEIVGNTRAAMVGDIDFLRGRGDPSMSQGVGADVTGRAPLTFDEVEAAMAEAPAAPVKQSAAEMRRQANIQRFGYDPNEVVERTPTDNAGFEAYLEQVNPGMKRIAEADRPNLMMGDMYGMKPIGSEVVGSKGDVTFHRSPDGEYYATAFNPDVNEEDVIGYITDRGDGTELAVVGEMQGQGVGGELQYLFRSENPNAPTGGLTEAGEGSLRRTYDRLADEGIVDGDVPFGGASAPEALLPAPRNEAEAMAKQVLEMRAAGRAGDVTDDMMALADDPYMYDNTPLSMDEASRITRARESGQNVDREFYRGGGTDRDYLSADAGTFKTQNTGVFMDPNPMRAETYAKQRGGVVAPLFSRSDAPIVFGDMSDWNRLEAPVYAYDPVKDVDIPIIDQSGTTTTDDIVRAARQNDIEAIEIQDITDPGPMRWRNEDKSIREYPQFGTTRVEFNPANIRSRFARFDPEFRNLKNLSAGVGGAAVLSSMGEDAEAGTVTETVSSIKEKYPLFSDIEVNDLRDQGVQDGRRLEFTEAYDDRYDKPLIEIFDPTLQGEELEKAIIGEFLHEAPRRIPEYAELRERLQELKTPQQLQDDVNNYLYDVENYGEDRPFEKWDEVSRKDAFIRGHAVGQWEPEYYTDEQKALIDEMMGLIKSGANK